MRKLFFPKKRNRFVYFIDLFKEPDFSLIDQICFFTISLIYTLIFIYLLSFKNFLVFLLVTSPKPWLIFQSLFLVVTFKVIKLPCGNKFSQQNFDNSVLFLFTFKYDGSSVFISFLI